MRPPEPVGYGDGRMESGDDGSSGGSDAPTVIEPSSGAEPSSGVGSAMRKGAGPPDELVARQMLADVRREMFGEASDDPTRVGRYVVLRTLGEGGMGRVFLGFDVDLDRKVAIKLLHTGSRQTDTEGKTRLLREAQALARLSHPNVVTVHEVGTQDDEVFVVMEYVEGETLSDWSRASPRNYRDVLAVFDQAGRGLAAAHAHGMVHRDFKPANVLLGDDGRVRVADFGLARATSEEDPGGESTTSRERTLVAAESAGAEQLLSAQLTEVGIVMGTPAYMAPEQHRGRGIDARTDQFSFCVALYEALYGERPYLGADRRGLIMAARAGKVPPVPRGTSVPSWVREPVLRGLRPDPDDRWPSMEALLGALATDPALERRRWVVGLGLIGLTGLAVAGAFGGADETGNRCGGGADRVAEVWNDEHRETMRRAFVDTGLTYADTTWTRTSASLDDYAQRWNVAHRETCEATHVRGEQSDALLDRSMRCLDGRLAALDATVGVLSDADEAVLRRAVEVVTGLPPLGPCSDADVLLAQVPPPEDPAIRSAVEEQRSVLLDAAAMERAGKYRRALDLARGVLETAEGVEYVPLVAEAALAVGRYSDRAGMYEDARSELERSYLVALENGHDEVAADASLAMIRVAGDKLSEHEEGLRWSRQAAALVGRVGSPPEKRAVLEGATGSVLNAKGEYPEALAHYEAALQIRSELPDGAELGLVATLVGLGNVAKNMGRYDRSIDYHRRALDIVRRALGDDHPRAATAHNNLGIALRDDGQLELARGHYESALRIQEASLGGDHLHVGLTVNNVAVLLATQGRFEEALPWFERSLAIQEKQFGATHVRVISPLTNLGLANDRLGRYEEARQLQERALAIADENLEAKHPLQAQIRTNLGGVFHGLGNHERALELHQASLEAIEQGIGLDHANAAYPLAAIGEEYRDLGDLARSREYLERALALRKEGDVEHATFSFELGLTLWEIGKNRATARDMIRDAKDRLAAAEGADPADLATIEDWLREHPG